MKNKPFRGYCKFELFDAKTGKIERCEHHNLVTDALTEFYKQGGMSNPSAFGASALRSDALYYLLGGVMCLDTALDEDDNIIRVPAGVSMTANGARGNVNTGNPPELGSWNELESGWTQDGAYRMVFDWDTSHGNGTIACVCLSSIFHGFEGIGNRSETTKTNPYHMGQYNSPTSMESFPNWCIGYKANSILTASLANVSEWTVAEYAYPKSQIDIRDSLANRLINTKTVQIPNDLKNLDGAYTDYWTRRMTQQIGDTMYIALMRSTHNYDPSRTTYYFTDEYPVLLIAYNVQTDAVTVTKISPSTTGLEGFTTTSYPTMGISSKWFILDKYAIDLSNLVNVIEIAGMAGGYNFRPLTDDTFMANGMYIDLDSETIYPTNGTSGTYYDTDHMDKLLNQNSSYVWRDPRFIATIFNLEEPVTKDASKTMKVTYVIRFS